MEKIAMLKNNPLIIPIALIICATLSRLIPHAPNFSPVLSIALFAGATISNKRYAFAVPLLTMLISDAFIGFHSLSIPIYLIMMFITFLGAHITTSTRSAMIGAYSLGSSCLFFVLSNFTVWIFSSFYAKNMGGLLKCYVAAIPFFHNTLISTLMYSALLFGLLRVIQHSHLHGLVDHKSTIS